MQVHLRFTKGYKDRFVPLPTLLAICIYSLTQHKTRVNV
jgi:hypothetical protein